jgi:hypothetical protein
VIVGGMADRMTDPIARLKAHANEAVSELVSTMRSSGSEALRLKAAQDILSRAGYGENRKVTVDDQRVPVALQNAETLRGLSEALDASRRVRDIDYRQHMQASPQGGVVGLPDLPKLQPGAAAEVSSASPSAPHEAEAVVRPAWAQREAPRVTDASAALELSLAEEDDLAKRRSA